MTEGYEELLEQVDILTKELEAAKIRISELGKALSRNANDKTGVRNGPGSGTWAVFAEDAVATRDEALAKLDEYKKWVNALTEDLVNERSASAAMRAALLARCPRHCKADHELGTCEMTRREINALTTDAGHKWMRDFARKCVEITLDVVSSESGDDVWLDEDGATAVIDAACETYKDY